VTGRALRFLSAAVLAAALACSSAPTASTHAAPTPCAGLVPPKLVAPGPVNLPPTYVSARLTADVYEEIVVGRDGEVRQKRLVASAIPPLVPFADASLDKTRFIAGAIEGNPVAVRGTIVVPIGGIRRPVKDPPDQLRVFVPGGVSREALWQLAGSVDRVTLVARLGAAIPTGAAIVAAAPSGVEKTLLAIPAAPPPIEVRETVRTARFFSDPGDYRVELRAAGKVLASTTLTIAPGFETAIVNACEPLEGPEKTGPGR